MLDRFLPCERVAATLLMLALTRTEWTLLEFVCELFHYAWGETESRLKIVNSRPFDAWVDTRFYFPLVSLLLYLQHCITLIEIEAILHGYHTDFPGG